MKKRILSLTIALTFIIAFIPAATAAAQTGTSMIIHNVTIEVPGIPGMMIEMYGVWGNYFYRESDGTLVFAVNYPADFVDGELVDWNDLDSNWYNEMWEQGRTTSGNLIFDRDLTLYPNDPPDWFDPDSGLEWLVPPISAKSGELAGTGWYHHHFTIDGVTVYFFQPSGEPWEVFLGGAFMGQHYDGLIQKYTAEGFAILPISSIAAGGSVLPPEAPNVSAASSWAREYINEAYAGGYLPEELQKDYRDDITRGEFVRLAMSWLRHHTGMTNAQLVAGYAQFPNRSFDDTDDEELTAAGILGITNGNGQGQFLENMGFNREQAAAMLTRTYALLGFETENAPAFGWEDLSAASGWARNDMNFVGEHNIMQGTAPPAKIFSPKDPFTRQQSIITFVRIDRNID